MNQHVQIQKLEQADLALITELQPADWQDIMPTIEYYIRMDFCFPIKATIDGHIAGIGTAILHKRVAWLAHIVVHPNYRNKGVGGEITRALVNNVQHKGIESIYLTATQLGEPVYKKIGFQVENAYLFYKDISMPENKNVIDCILPYSSTFKTQIQSIDLLSSGEDRMCHLTPYFVDGFIYVRKNVIEGYYLPSLGDGLIIANTTIAGIELMKFRFKTMNDAAFPEDNLVATDFMNRYNYEPFKKVNRMWLGKKLNWIPENMYNRIGGNVG